MPEKENLQKEITDQEIENIEVFGARVHNLKNIDIKIPRNKLVVITGISGSGKSSLAFDTIYAEGQRRYLESYSTYVRQFIGGLERPDVDQITGLTPVVSIEQKTTNKNPRSTVGTVTEIYDFMRLLFARAGEAYSFESGKKMVRFTDAEILEHLFTHFRGRKILLLAPVVRGRKGHYRELFEQIRKQGFLKVRVDGEILEVKEKMQVDRFKVHDIEVVIDRMEIEKPMKERLSTSLQMALKLGKGLVMITVPGMNEVHHFSKRLMDPESGISYDEPSPNHFSFNSPYGACTQCKGLGVMHEVDLDAVIPDKTKSINEGGIAPIGEVRDNYTFNRVRALAKKHKFNLSDPVGKLPKNILELLLYGTGDQTLEFTDDENPDDRFYNEFEGVVPMLKRFYRDTTSEGLHQWAENFLKDKVCNLCNGTRLKKESLHFKIDGKNISELSLLDISKLYEWFENVEERLNEKQMAIARDVLKEIRIRIHFLINVGLSYLSLNRATRSLSGGESQRIRLATQIGSQLVGITYILDEPSIGLHPRDNVRLIKSLKSLRDSGNTVIVVEHDKDIMLESDHIIDLGPGAGEHGGKIVGEGSPEDFKKQNTITSSFLNGNSQITFPAVRRSGNGKFIRLKNASGNNLKNISVDLALGKFICVTGVSGSGKSTLINDTLYTSLRHYLYNSRQKPLAFEKIEGMQLIDKVIEIDQSPIGRTPRSNPSTYIGVFADIRALFAILPEAKIRGYKPGRFSFNVQGGRCEECQGGGMKVIEMNFLPDVNVLCEKCLGKRYNRETLEVRYKGKSISDVLEMPVDEAVSFFEAVPSIYRKIKSLADVGLGYITLGQSSTTISGGEAQRVKLAAELQKKDTGQTFYILDEPTTGLHFEDIRLLLGVLNKLVDRGNTVLVIEHNLDVIKVADYIIDLGPEGGDAGGYIIATGTPEEIANNPKSYTGQFLKNELKSQRIASTN